jgi:ribonuclease P protein component
MASTSSKAAPAVRCAGGPPRHYGESLTTLKKRGEFLRLRGGVRWSGPAFLLEGKARVAPLPEQASIKGVRFGFTITKKLGKAHERNRMRRRLSHALRLVTVPVALETWDCVIVARKPALDRPFDALVADFRQALARLANSRPPRAPRQDSTAAGGGGA